MPEAQELYAWLTLWGRGRGEAGRAGSVAVAVGVLGFWDFGILGFWDYWLGIIAVGLA